VIKVRENYQKIIIVKIEGPGAGANFNNNYKPFAAQLLDLSAYSVFAYIGY